MENASRAFLDAVRTSMRQIRSAVDTATVDVALLTAAERIQYEGYLCREEANAAILRLKADGIPIKEIVRRTGHSRGLVRKVVRGQRTDLFRTRESSLEVHLPWLEEQWSAGSRNGAEQSRRLRKHGFRGSLRVVTEWATRRRRTERAPTGTLGQTPSARTVARLMSVGRDALSRTKTLTVAAIETGVPLLVEARELIASFQGMIRKRTAAELGPWLARARSSLVASFATGITKDEAAVTAALNLTWSNGQTEGQITKLKLVKRQMYGRGKIDMLQARMIRTTRPASPKVRQSQHWTPIKDQNCEPFDTKSGIFVVEVDQHGEDGEALLRQACKRLGELPPTLEQRSGGGGRHKFFRYPEGRRMRTTASVIGRGIDTRADNNSCILTPSLHPSGNRHRWSTPVRTNNCADLPAKWISKLEKVERPTIAAPMPRLRIMSHIGDRLIDSKVSEIARCGNGQRNTQIYRATYYLAKRAAANVVDWQRAHRSLVWAGKSCGLDPVETLQTITSAAAGAGLL